MGIELGVLTKATDIAIPSYYYADIRHNGSRSHIHRGWKPIRFRLIVKSSENHFTGVQLNLVRHRRLLVAAALVDHRKERAWRIAVYSRALVGLTRHAGRSPAFDDQPAPPGAPAQFAVLVTQAWLRWITRRRRRGVAASLSKGYSAEVRISAMAYRFGHQGV
jgi:hypothetical protein